MTSKIETVTIKTQYKWDDVRNLKNWNSVNHVLPSWQALTQTIGTNGTVTIEVTVGEVTWKDIEKDFLNWRYVKEVSKTWLDIYQYEGR